MVHSSDTRVFDCFLYCGEEDVLEIRFNELWDVVDRFVIVESDQSFTGHPKKVTWDPDNPRFAKFLSKVRHVVVRDMPDTDNPWDREAWQRNAVLRGVEDAGPDDLFLLSDVDEIPRSNVVLAIAEDHEQDIVGLKLAMYYFYVNYRNVAGPEVSRVWSIAARRRALDSVLPDDMRKQVRDRKTEVKTIDDAGWHFSYLFDVEAVKKKIASFSHQELNTPEILARIDPAGMVSERKDLFDRPGFVWEVTEGIDLPVWLKANKRRFRHLFFRQSTWKSVLSRVLESFGRKQNAGNG